MSPDSSHVTSSAPERRIEIDLVGIARADRRRDLGDRTTVAVDVLEDDDVLRPRDDVAEHGAGLDRRQLRGVADEDQLRVRTNRLDEPRHHRQSDHRRLVDDHDVVRQAVAAVMAEAAVAARPPAEQAVKRRGLEIDETRLGVHGLTQPRRRLAGRRRERDQRPRLLRGQLPDEPRDRRRLTGPRAAGDHSQALAACTQVGGNLALLAPVAIEVQPRALQAQRRQRARGHARDPLLGRRPRQGAEVDGLLGLDARGLRDRREVDEHMPQPRGAHREREREHHELVVLPAQGADALGDVHVGGREHADLVERLQQTARAQRQHHAAPRSSRSLNATTKPPGGRQAKTPPPGIPRRKR